ncbi:MAG TPA: cytochrome c, partial [Magnetococcales bacterium]|nr:cytochrome c [Magnetococcales bacterium]
TNPLIHLYKLLADASFFDETKGLELDKFTSALSSAPKTEESEKSKTAPSVYQPRVAGRQSQTARPLPPYSGRGADDGTKKRFFSRGLMLSVGTIMVAGLLIGSYPVWKKTLAEWITLQTTSQSDRGEKRDLDGDGVILSPESKTKIHSVQRGKKIDRITYFYQNGLADYYCRVFLNTLCNQGSLNLNPLKSDSKAMEDGNMLFSRHCVRCHGIKGRGMGMEAAQLETPPTSLAFVAERVLERDAYMFWSIAEGGTPFKSAMPPYKDVLSTKEIWSIIVYLGML